MEEQNYRSDEEQPNEMTYSGSIKNMKKEANAEPSRMKCHEYEKTIQDLLEKIDILEKRLEGVNKQKLKATSMLKDLEDENTNLKDIVAKTCADNKLLSDVNLECENKIKDLKNTNQKMNDDNIFRVNSLNKVLEEKEKNLNDLNQKMRVKDETLKYYTVNNRLTQQYSNGYKQDLEQQILINKQQANEISALKKKIDALYVKKQNEGTLLLEIEHLKDDNIRLLQMLKTTDQFADFNYLGHTSTGGIRYIRPCDEPEKSEKSTDFNSTQGTMKSKAAKTKKTTKEISDEYRNKQSRAKSSQRFAAFKQEKEYKKTTNKKNWVPDEAFDYISLFKNKYNLDISEALINDLLTSLNNIWQEREQAAINQIRSSYQNEIKNLKFRLDAMKDKPIEVGKGSKSASKNASMAINRTLLNKTSATVYNAPSQKANEKYEAYLINEGNTKSLENEVRMLKRKLAEKNTKFVDTNTEYNQGSLWMAERCSNEINTLKNNVDDLFIEYEDKVKVAMKEQLNKEYNMRVVNNSAKWLFTSLKALVQEVNEKVKGWKWDIQRNLNSLKYAGSQYS